MQSLTGAVARHDKDQRTFQASASPIQNPKGLSVCKTGHKNHRKDHGGQSPRHSQAPTARMDSVSNGPVPTSWPRSGKCSPKIETKDNQKAIECLPNPAIATVITIPEADRRPSVASQLAEKAPKNKPSLGKEPNVKKSGTLAQRMKLPSLPVITDDHGRPMGFAAMLSAQDDPRYASHAVKDGETASPENMTSSANGVPKSISPVPPKAIVALSPPCQSVAKPRLKKAPTKNTDSPQPTLNILKSNRKRPLSEMGIHELFTPGQVISNSVWEARKRQRIEKTRHRAVEHGSGTKGIQNGVGTGPVEEVNGAGKYPEEFPDVTEFGAGAVQVQDTPKTASGEVPEMGTSPLEEQHTTSTITSELPGTRGPSPVEMSNTINDLATILPVSCATEQTSTYKLGTNPDKQHNAQLNSKKEVSQVERLKSIVQGPIESRKATFEAPKNVRFEEPKPSVKEPAPDKQITPSFEDEPTQPVTIEEPPPRQEAILSTRPTTAGKGISETTLAAWRAAEAEDISHTTPYHSIDEQEEDLIAVTESTYHYHVHRREWLTEDPEGEANAEEQLLGPFYTLQEANSVATKEIRHPIQLGTLHSIPSSAWDYSFRQDHDGLQTQVAEAIGVHIEAEVSRGKPLSLRTSQSKHPSNKHPQSQHPPPTVPPSPPRPSKSPPVSISSKNYSGLPLPLLPPLLHPHPHPPPPPPSAKP